MKRRGKGKEDKTIALETIILIFHFFFFQFQAQIHNIWYHEIGITLPIVQLIILVPAASQQ